MEVLFTPEQEARLSRLAARTGQKQEQMIGAALDQMLDYNESFLAAVDEGRLAARCGDLLEHDEVVERIEQKFRS